MCLVLFNYISFCLFCTELYSYTEEPEFSLNRDYFEEDFKNHVKGRRWMELSMEEQRAYVMRLLDALEVTDRDKRLKVARAILYLAQGVFDECDTETDVLYWSRHNVFLLYDMGIFTALLELLSMEIDNNQACSSAVRKPAISLADSTELRVLLSIMYLMVETIRVEMEGDSPERKAAREAFKTELGERDCERTVWPLVLQIYSVCVCVLPLLIAWKETVHMPRNRSLPQTPFVHSLCCGLPLVKQDSLDTYNERDPFKNDDVRDEEDDPEDMDSGIEGEVDPLDRDVIIQPPLPPPLLRPPTERLSFPKGLPWAPKYTLLFLVHTVFSFFLMFYSDTDTLVGLPRPIHESVKTLKQVSMETFLFSNILGEEEVEEIPAEILYLGMLPSLSQYVIALLKLLLAAAPTSKAKTDSINILADVLPEEMPITVLQSMKLGIDVNRHKEIIVKAIAAVLLLLLKHFKLNHIFQFEYVAQHLVFANCIPLILKFFNQNIMSYISAKNSICALDFPHCVVHEMPELTAESLEAGDSNQFCWRNLFSCINLLRILNKITKWKHSRTMMLVVFKSAPILKRALKVKQAMMQLYVLKLLKIQTKYLGRQWRKSNMKTMSAIYQKVRHRLNDDWAYGNGKYRAGGAGFSQGWGQSL
uniref:Striatin-interacting protein 1 homolog n=1 Tax=Sinocyclocheilus grahami TaxID=75366 RepID=A0A672RTN2_SINGR